MRIAHLAAGHEIDDEIGRLAGLFRVFGLQPGRLDQAVEMFLDEADVWFLDLHLFQTLDFATVLFNRYLIDRPDRQA